MKELKVNITRLSRVAVGTGPVTACQPALTEGKVAMPEWHSYFYECPTMARGKGLKNLTSLSLQTFVGRGGLAWLSL